MGEGCQVAGGGGEGGSGWGVQIGSERRIEVFVKIKKNGGGGVGSGGQVGGSQGRCNREVKFL